MASGISMEMGPNFGEELGRQIQQKLDAIYAQYAGQPFETVKAALEREGFSGDDDNNLDPLATAISSGHRVEVGGE